MYITMSHISCLISAHWLHNITCMDSNIQFQLLHSVTKQLTKSIDMLYKNTLDVIKSEAKLEATFNVCLSYACD